MCTLSVIVSYVFMIHVIINAFFGEIDIGRMLRRCILSIHPTLSRLSGASSEKLSGISLSKTTTTTITFI